METVSTALRLHSQLITFGIKGSRLGASDLNLFKLLKTLTAIEFSLRRVTVAQPTSVASGSWAPYCHWVKSHAKTVLSLLAHVVSCILHGRQPCVCKYFQKSLLNGRQSNLKKCDSTAAHIFKQHYFYFDKQPSFPVCVTLFTVSSLIRALLESVCKQALHGATGNCGNLLVSIAMAGNKASRKYYVFRSL